MKPTHRPAGGAQPQVHPARRPGARAQPHLELRMRRVPAQQPFHVRTERLTVLGRGEIPERVAERFFHDTTGEGSPGGVEQREPAVYVGAEDDVAEGEHDGAVAGVDRRVPGAGLVAESGLLVPLPQLHGRERVVFREQLAHLTAQCRLIGGGYEVAVNANAQQVRGHILAAGGGDADDARGRRAEPDLADQRRRGSRRRQVDEREVEVVLQLPRRIGRRLGVDDAEPLLLEHLEQCRASLGVGRRDEGRAAVPYAVRHAAQGVERLQPGHAARVLGERLAGRALYRAAVGLAQFVDAAAVDADAVAAIRLRQAERLRRSVEQVLRRQHVRAVDGDAGAHGGQRRGLAGRAQLFLHAAGEDDRALLHAAGEDCDEGLRPEARGEVHAPRLLAQQRREALQHGVTRGATVARVELLHVIDVEQDDGECAAAFGGSDLHLQVELRVPSVRQPGHVVE
jgi:hypothetical protein